MKRVTKWLKSLFGLNKEKPHKQNSIFSTNSGGIGHIPAEAYYRETEKERNKHAIAVAAATAAAADAAVAAAHAAVAVVRLTSQGRGTMFAGGSERWAAVKIQSVFRGFLARKALRALKGLVKLQALVRGFLVRKQAAATLFSMEALFRAQATVYSRRASAHRQNNISGFQIRARKSMERFDETKSEYLASIHSKRSSASNDTVFTTADESPKIVEIDTGLPKLRSRRINTSISEFSENPYQIPPPASARLSIPNCWNLHHPEFKPFSSAQTTPRFLNTPATPAQCIYADAENFFLQYGHFPSYMANTKSFKAKLRSMSAPKQRPEIGMKKKVLLKELMESRSSLSGINMEKSCSKAQDAINFRNVVMGKLDRSSEFVKFEN